MMTIQSSLINWFLQNRRSFPWREDPTPYRVWISEVMLQQTRASVVVPYFEKWLEQFPTIESLAQAPIEKVIKTWEGLGYYSRARNLYRGAQYILSKHQGTIPASFEELLEIPGIGRYTAAAILSFGFKQRAVPVDGNVARVIARYGWIDLPADKAAGKLAIEQKGSELLDSETPWISAEALIELGATLCTPTKPKCTDCPLLSGCMAAKRRAPEALPMLSPRPVITKLIRGVAVIEVQEKVLIRKNPSTELMGDLYEFPTFEGAKSTSNVSKEATAWYKNELKLIARWKPVSHTFTRYKAFLYPYYFQAGLYESIEGFEWVLKEALVEIPFSSGHRKILRNFFM